MLHRHGHQAQNLIAGEVTKAVIERLEVIDISEQQGQRFDLFGRIRDSFVQCSVKVFSIGELGERVGQALSADRLEAYLKLVDLLLGGDQPLFQLLVGSLHDLGGLHQVFDDDAKPVVIF